jgi:hypothetical protein
MSGSYQSRPGAGQGAAGNYRSGGTYNRPSQLPANPGSIVNSGSVTGPRGGTIGGVQGPRGGGAVGVQGPGGASAAAIKGPRGGGAAAVQGPRGGTAGAVTGPRGGGAAGVVGPGGGAAGAIRGPGGAGAAGIRGPAGGTAGAVWGRNGYGVAGGTGRYGNRWVTTLPAGAIRYPWRGSDYWHAGYGWFRPSWVGDALYYAWTYPPTGYYYPSLPDNSQTVVINNTTYYESEGVYYQEGEEGGKKGYVVAEAPPGTESAEGAAANEEKNPYDLLKSMCDYIAPLDKLTFVAQATNDQIADSGDKIQVSSRRTVNMSRPDKVSINVTSNNGDRRVVYANKKVSMLDRTKNVYTELQVPDTIDATLDTLAKDYNIVVPLEDFMYKDLYERMVSRAVTGQYLGIHKVRGVKCHHVAFSAGTSNWELWIDAGDRPVPRKITIDYGQGAQRLRYSADIVEWNSQPTFAADTFEFNLPGDAKRFEMTPSGA